MLSYQVFTKINRYRRQQNNNLKFPNQLFLIEEFSQFSEHFHLNFVQNF
jgi:hypothetical protein